MISISSTIDSVVFKSGRLVDQTGATRSSLEYEVEYRTLPEGTVEVDDLFPDEAFAVAGFTVALRRSVLSHVMNTFLPSLLMVITASVRSVLNQDIYPMSNKARSIKRSQRTNGNSAIPFRSGATDVTFSFWIPSTSIPGRMGLLVTSYLVLINIAAGNSDRYRLDAFTAVDAWLYG